MKNVSLLCALSILVLTSCGGKSAKKSSNINSEGGLTSMNDLKFKKGVVDQDENGLYSLNIQALKDTIRVPLSDFVESIELVTLEDNDDALVGSGIVHITDKHFLAKSFQDKQYKFFNRDGSFVCKVGSIGQGPGEYNLVYSEYVDEENERIYLLPWNAEKLLVFNFKGEYLKGIPLPFRIPKGVFHIDAEHSLVSLITLPFNTFSYFAWTQNFDGEVLNKVPLSKEIAIEPDFSNEISKTYSGDNLSFHFLTLWAGRQDSLYHYTFNENRVIPNFTIRFGEKIIQHSMLELPNHFIGTILGNKKEYEEGSFSILPTGEYAVNKSNKTASWVVCVNDLFDYSPIQDLELFLKNGYFSYMTEPIILKEQIEKQLKKDTRIDEERRAKLQEIVDNLNLDGNNVILFGKIKN